MRLFIVRLLSLSFLFISAVEAGFAQTSEGLVVYYAFDNEIEDETGNTSNIAPGNPAFGCGIAGEALQLSGLPDSYVLIFGPTIKNTFKTADFTISFYFKSLDPFGTKAILTKRFECDQDTTLALRYSPASRLLSCEVSESPGKTANVQQKLSSSGCWHHVVLVRRAAATVLYVDGVFQQSASAISRVGLESDEPLAIAYSPCLATTDKPFIGLMDELRIYNRALLDEEIEELYTEPDKIINRDTIIFLGGFVPVNITETCATDFDWSPINGVADPTLSSTTITPSTAGDHQYTLSMNDGECVATDTLKISVIDPSLLDCKQLFLPKAFTPNGDGLNETYGISNPYVIETLKSFEIFDRWGERVFFTVDPLSQWDGTFKGKPVNPGVMLYKVIYTCDGEEITTTGSITIIR
jgi:gliding motility-associated-like protein